MERKEVFRQRLCALRAGMRLSQKKIADALGMSTVGYQYYEYGRKLPSFDTLPKLAVLFNVSSDYLLGLSDDPHLPRMDEETRELFRAVHAFKAKQAQGQPA